MTEKDDRIAAGASGLAGGAPPLEYVWVALDIVRGEQSVGYRGRMVSSDYEALISGTFVLPFVRLELAHWAVYDKVFVLGQTGRWKWYDSSVHVRADSIVSIYLLKDEYARFFQLHEALED